MVKAIVSQGMPSRMRNDKREKNETAIDVVELLIPEPVLLSTNQSAFIFDLSFP
jgi:hypothetical protein